MSTEPRRRDAPEPSITINGTQLNTDQASMVRIACSDFLNFLEEDGRTSFTHPQMFQRFHDAVSEVVRLMQP